MILVNGRQQGSVSAADRGLYYGDGLFETIAVVDSRPQLWDLHMRRLELGCARLRLPPPSVDQLYAEASQVASGHDSAVIKLIWTAGAGGRGYRRVESVPTRVLAVSKLPEYPPQWWTDGVKVRLCQTRLASQPLLAGIKHLNRLEQVLARSEWSDPEVAEGLLLDQNDYVIEGTMSNLFAVQGERLLTPDLSHAGVAGVMREQIMAIAHESGLNISVEALSSDMLASSDEIFLTNSLIGIWPVARLGERHFRHSRVARRLQLQLEAAGVVPGWSRVARKHPHA